MRPVIYADLRCLQDIAYQFRGIGYHTTALLRSRKNSALANTRTVGLVDSRLPQLPPEFAALVDEVSSSLNPCSNGAPALFIDGSPMTHDSRFGLRFQNNPGFLRAAVLYDFIPLDWPGYLPTVAKRIEYISKISRLGSFDLFFPISEYTAWRVSELLGIPRGRIKVTGASVRRSLYEIRDRMPSPSSPYNRDEPFFVTLGGDDKRKNTEVAVKAVRNLNLLYSRRIPLKVLGHYGVAYKADLLRLAGHSEGAGFLEFYPNIPDYELVSLHAGALAAIAPSHIEGFSLPVTEASVCGCPVIASTCAAQMELIDQPEALFQSDDALTLLEKLDRLLHDPDLRASLVSSQAHLGAKFHEREVGARFWDTLALAFQSRHKSVSAAMRQKPRLAFLSPYPPDSSHAALYTAMTMGSNEKLFCSDLYTDAARPLDSKGSFRDAGAVSLAPLLAGRYNGVISVLGNSSGHTKVFEIFERYGGPCILHDVPLTDSYFRRLGPAKFLALAGKFLSRSVSMDEVDTWFQGGDLPSLFLEHIIDRASPLIVHTATQKTLLKKRYGVDAHVATSCPLISFDDEDLTKSAKQDARVRLGVAPNTFLVSSFGSPTRTKGMEICILAIELLRSWNIPAELYFVGNVGPEKGEINRISTLYGVTQHVHCGIDSIDDPAYRDYLVCSDAAVQLRIGGFGQLSDSLTDCITAGLTCVASSDLAQSCDAPAYVSVVPDRFSPLHVAEQLALIWETRSGRDLHTDARNAYLQTHNFEYYGKRLLEILEIA